MISPDNDELTYLLAPLCLQADLARRPEQPSPPKDWRYCSWAELVLAEGRLFDACPAEATWMVPKKHRGTLGTCFESATSYSQHAGVYVEGWAIAPGDVATVMGTEHAWCSQPDSTAVLDPTWSPGMGTVYFGLPVTAQFRASIASPMMLHPHDWGLSLLQNGLPPEGRAEAGRPLDDGLIASIRAEKISKAWESASLERSGGQA